eukprot:6065892-Prymnesium_polylepis.1
MPAASSRAAPPDATTARAAHRDVRSAPDRRLHQPAAVAASRRRAGHGGRLKPCPIDAEFRPSPCPCHRARSPRRRRR